MSFARAFEMPPIVLRRLGASCERRPRDKVEPLENIYVLCPFSFHPGLPKPLATKEQFSDKVRSRAERTAPNHTTCSRSASVVELQDVPASGAAVQQSRNRNRFFF
jgi:hypothetical protein